MTHNTTDKIHKTLYVSDMDGTLLTSEARLSDNTVTMLNTLIDKEIYCSLWQRLAPLLQPLIYWLRSTPTCPL